MTPSTPDNTCLWICYLVKFQLFGTDEANTTTPIKWSQKHKKLHPILLRDSIGEKGGRWEAVWYTAGLFAHAYECWGKLTPEPIIQSIFQTVGSKWCFHSLPCSSSARIISHLFESPKSPWDDEIEHENSVTAFAEESCTRTHSEGIAEQCLIW